VKRMIESKVPWKDYMREASFAVEGTNDHFLTRYVYSTVLQLPRATIIGEVSDQLTRARS
jgi:hypothetical protein